MSDPGTVAYLSKMERVMDADREKAQAISDYIKESAEENEILQGRLRQAINERDLLRMSLNEAQERVRIAEERWVQERGATPGEAEFRRKAIERARELEEKVRDLQRQLEAERQARVWHAQNADDESKRAYSRRMPSDEAGEWERSVETWRTRYEDALRRLDQVEAKLRRSGIDD